MTMLPEDDRCSRAEARSCHARLLALWLSVAAGCSFSSKGISNGTTDADGFGVGGSGGSAGSGGGGSGGSGGSLGTQDGAGGQIGAGPDGAGGGLAGGDGPLGAGGSGLQDALPAPADVPLPPPDLPKLGIGNNCSADGECETGYCTDGTCCEKRCGETCFSCGGGAATNASAGLCRPDVANTACGAAMCNGNTLTPAPRCDGMGGCGPRPVMACPNHLVCASATACKARCATAADCTGGLVCDVASGQCRVPGKPNGAVCAAGSECATGHCADKVCCDLACTGTCRACVMALTGQADGRCANLIAGTRDTACPVEAPSTCGRDGTCNANGVCARYPNGTTCGSGCCQAPSAGVPGGMVPAVCNFRCTAGTCSRDNPQIVDRCSPGCCCPNAGQPGAPACLVVGALCPGQCVN